MEQSKLSANSLIEATRGRAKFSGHGNAKGAAGYLSDTDDSCSFLGATGQTEIFDPRENGFGKIRIGAAWQNTQAEQRGFFRRIFGKFRTKGLDLDLGCLYELQDGSRGCVQAFGEMFGSFDKAPFISLSGDDRTGDDHDDDEGEDEFIMLNGHKWPEIRRILFYLYIYGGAAHWAEVRPQIQIRIPGEKPVAVVPHTYKEEMALCAVAGLENIRNGIKVTNYTEYYPGHAEMDRAFGFGLDWSDGVKRPV